MERGGENKNHEKCKFQQKYMTFEKADCVCGELRPVVIGDWSDCILQHPDEVNNAVKVRSDVAKKPASAHTQRHPEEDLQKQAYCGSGVRYKVISCQTSSRDMEGSASCSAVEYEEEPCTISCPVDCLMHPWSEWSQCSVTCGSGIQQRYRSVKTQSENGGRKCPTSYGYTTESQTRVCVSPVSTTSGTRMTGGRASPMVATSVEREHRQGAWGKCFAVMNGLARPTPLDPSYCPGNERPANVQACDLPCPGHCVMSDWTEWTPCRQPCNGKQTQVRSRKVLRTAGQNCMAQQDVRVCLKGDTCIEYSWELSDWTSCLVNDGSEVCGVGHKERFALCRNEAGQRVDDHKCIELFGPMTEPLVVSCEIPCDNDCLLSDWSDWSTCTRTCGLGVTTRYRVTVQAPTGNGRKCPGSMDQSRPCFLQGCYRWMVTDWTSCRTQKGVCGQGMQERNVSCVGEDGQPVNSTRCPHDTEKLVLKTRQPCRVPCPGECRLSEWSEWSTCYIGCQDFREGFRTGVRARSRAILVNPSVNNPPCDDTLWDEETCQTDTCLNFTWNATPWSATGLRTVTCRRSDGFVVEGGCNDAVRPADVLTCVPECTPLNSKCVDSNLCSCVPPYRPVYSPNNTLTDCVMNTTTTPAAGGTTDVQPVSTTSIWMYAVIAVGTIFVISVAAALYNMCELFRTGPRPRRKANQASKTASGADLTPSATRRTGDSDYVRNTEMEELYKQVVPRALRSDTRNNHPDMTSDLTRDPDPAYQNLDPENLPTPDLAFADSGNGRRAESERNAAESCGPTARSNVGLGVRLPGRGSREEQEHLLPPSCPLPHPPLPPACSYPLASGLATANNRRYPAWRGSMQSMDGGFFRKCGVFSACLSDASPGYEDEGRAEERVQMVPDASLDSLRTPCLAHVRRQGGGGEANDVACVEVHCSVSGLTNHPNCMLRDSHLRPSSRPVKSPPCRPLPGRPVVSPSPQESPLPTSKIDTDTNSTASEYISASRSAAGDNLTEELELDGMQLLPLDISLDPSSFRGDRTGAGAKGSLSNISEMSFDKPPPDSCPSFPAQMDYGNSGASVQQLILPGAETGRSSVDSSPLSGRLRSSQLREEPLNSMLGKTPSLRISCARIHGSFTFSGRSRTGL
ncbi:hypothetical protein C0Q70_04224 [Pomacea canaliculata]|uniref:Spondin-like TSP1 domain-containing protein n=1 Tax=Pomacea canaliculata TaxID=400727 RepID=A0A2T7PUY7_POMCA|nr:hypothetical protein C0Q70_04224 [Pomacea canaliculata]